MISLLLFLQLYSLKMNKHPKSASNTQKLYSRQRLTHADSRGSGQEVALTAFSAPGRCGWRSGLDSSSNDYFAPGETSGNRGG